jgi:ankyrin repeat protein
MWASASGHLEAVEALCKYGASVKEVSNVRMLRALL